MRRNHAQSDPMHGAWNLEGLTQRFVGSVIDCFRQRLQNPESDRVASSY